MKKIIITLVIIGFVSTAIAGKTYTPSQLNQMIRSGHYPAQGEATSQSKPMSFNACKRVARNIMSQIRTSYPVKTIVDTSALYMVKAWANDGIIIVSCSEPDKKMVITQAPYK